VYSPSDNSTVMPPAANLVRIASLKTPTDFRRHVAALGIELPCEDEIVAGVNSPLNQPLLRVAINGKRIGNRYAVQPMEGWDGTKTGGITADVRRRWRRFGESGAKLICGGEAMAVIPEARANPHQLIINSETEGDLAELVEIATAGHAERCGNPDDLVIGFQLTHSGRFCRPNDQGRSEPRVAYRHPILDRRFGVVGDEQVLRDEEVSRIIGAYVDAARIAWNAGADFVDIKHCHGYLLHEFLSAYTRPGRYGGSFENRTRPLREIVAGIRASGNSIDLAVRLSAFDFVPFHPDPALSQPRQPGPGIPEDFKNCLPYRYAFGVDAQNPVVPDLGEALDFARLCVELGIKILNVTAGSPYYNPHIQRPAAYPPSDGYQPPEDPLVGVARQMQAARTIRQFLAEDGNILPGAAPLVVGSAYSYLQEYLPHVAQAVIREQWTDLVGIGRMVLSYPGILADAIQTGTVNSKAICRTFSDCTTAPRQGLVSGCYPLDKYYAAKPEAQQLKAHKRP
jgi:2,4-dienoyl-CoA reductase-like NADH-dependent reductase (Old Yellow Enzyme family)